MSCETLIVLRSRVNTINTPQDITRPCWGTFPCILIVSTTNMTPKAWARIVGTTREMVSSRVRYVLFDTNKPWVWTSRVHDNNSRTVTSRLGMKCLLSNGIYWAPFWGQTPKPASFHISPPSPAPIITNWSIKKTNGREYNNESGSKPISVRNATLCPGSRLLSRIRLSLLWLSVVRGCHVARSWLQMPALCTYILRYTGTTPQRIPSSRRNGIHCSSCDLDRDLPTRGNHRVTFRTYRQPSSVEEGSARSEPLPNRSRYEVDSSWFIISTCVWDHNGYNLEHW